MRAVFIFFMAITTLMVPNNAFGQKEKTKIALVSYMDTTLTLMYMSQEKKLNINLVDNWKHELGTCLSSNYFKLQWEDVPEDLKGIRSYTNGFSKANPKLKEWFSALHEEKGYSIIILLGKANLWGGSKMNWHSYGMDIKHNFVFSLNRIIIYNAETSKIECDIAGSSMEEIMRYLNKDTKIEKPLNDINENDVRHAIPKILEFNAQTVERICYCLRSYIYSIKH